MGSESDLEELHSSILSLCEEDPQSRTLNQTLNLSPIKSDEASFVETPSVKNLNKEKCTPSTSTFASCPVLEVGEIFSKRAHSTPLVPKRLCSSPVSSCGDHATITEKEEDEGLEDLRNMTYEDLLSEVTILCDLPGKHLLKSEGPSKPKMEDSLKSLNQTQLSKINMETILCQSYIPKDKEKTDKEAASQNPNTEVKTPGRFADLSTTPMSSLLVEDEVEDELVEDILGLDEFIFSDLDSDDNFDEETLLSGEDTVVFDKSAKNDSMGNVTVLERKDSNLKKNDKKSLHLPANKNAIDLENNNLESVKSKNSNTKISSDVNANFVSSGQKRKDTDFDEQDSKKTKLSNANTLVSSMGISSKGVEKDKAESSVEYVIVSMIDSSESDFDSKSEAEDKDDNLEEDKPVNRSKRIDVPMLCVSPLIQGDHQSSRIESTTRQQKEKELFPSKIDYRYERSFLKNENELTRSVMKKWKTDGIHNPDRNLTHATSFRRKTNGEMGMLEGFHFTTLHVENNEDGPDRKNDTKTRSLADTIQKLKMEQNELERLHYCRLRDMKFMLKSRIEEQDMCDRNRLRHLRIQQEMEVRSVHYQYANSVFKQTQLMQLKMDHLAQIDHIQCIAMREEQSIKDKYLNSVTTERTRFEEQFNQMTSLIQQLSQCVFEDKEEHFGPQVMVSLVKAPCRANNESKTHVSVCLPLEIANAILKEDELYDNFYEY